MSPALQADSLPAEPQGNTGVGSLFLLQWNLLDPGIKPESPALQADSLPTERSGKPSKCWEGIKLTHVARVLLSIFSNYQGPSSTSLPPSHIPQFEMMLLPAWQLFWLGKTVNSVRSHSLHLFILKHRPG